MRSRQPRQSVLTRTNHLLGQIAAQVAQRPMRHRPAWLASNLLRPQLTGNLALMRELYKLAGAGQLPAIRVAYRVRYLLNVCEQAVRQNVLQSQRSRNTVPQNNMLPPDHPAVIANIYHPLNPNNPLNIQLNPGLNLAFQQKESAEREAAFIQTMLTDPAFQATQGETRENTDSASASFAAYLALGLNPNPSQPYTQEEIEAAGLAQLAQYAPESDTESHHTSHERCHEVATAMRHLLLETASHSFVPTAVTKIGMHLHGD